MNELRQALLPGEEIIFETRKHWMAPIRDSLIAILFVIGGLILWLLAPPGGEGLFGSIGGMLGTLMWWIGLGLLVVGVGLDRLEHRGLAVGQLRRLQHARPVLRGPAPQAQLRDAPELDHRRQADRAGARRHARLRRPDHPHRVGRRGQRQVHDHQASGGIPDGAAERPDRREDGAPAAAARPQSPIAPARPAGAADASPCRTRPTPPGPDTGAGAICPGGAHGGYRGQPREAGRPACRGVITDAEFEAKKAELLGRI